MKSCTSLLLFFITIVLIVEKKACGKISNSDDRDVVAEQGDVKIQ